MHPKSPKWLDDLVDACAYIVEKTTGTDEAAFVADRSLRQVVECNFEIIGEALLRLERTDPTTTARISDYRQVIGLRNRLVHGYDDVDYQRVWDIIQHALPILEREAKLLLK